MDGYHVWTKCVVCDRNVNTNPSDLEKAGIKQTVSIAGGMSYIKREDDSTRRKWRL